MAITGEAVGQALAVGIIAFLFLFGIGLALRRWTSRAENVRSSLFAGAMLGVMSFIGATVDLPQIHLEPPLSTILLAGLGVIAVAGSLFFFRLMLRDGSRED